MDYLLSENGARQCMSLGSDVFGHAEFSGVLVGRNGARQEGQRFARTCEMES